MEHLVLAGGGHAHLAVLSALARDPLRDIEVTLVTPASKQAYSGMLPGWIAGHYIRPQIEIDLESLARRANVTLLRDCVVAMNADRRSVAMSDGQQSLKPARFEEMMNAIRPLAEVMGKTL